MRNAALCPPPWIWVTRRRYPFTVLQNRFFGAGREKDHAAHQSQHSRTGGRGKRVLFSFPRWLEAGPKSRTFLLRGVGDALIGEGHDAEDEKYESS